MENKVIHRAENRGHADHGWLKAKHSFSFANYYNPNQMHFGVLRVLNDDYVEPGMGFGTHPHDNMEIITIPLEGALEHKDNMNNHGIIKYGDVQVMSAGSGVTHSEFNASKTEAVKLFQIWLYPDKENVKPRYDQLSLNVSDRKNKLQTIVSPETEKSGLWIHQQAWLSMGNFDKDKNTTYKVKKEGNGIYAMIVKGEFEINNNLLHERDAIGMWNTSQINLIAKSEGAEILLMDIPMQLN
ncbi:MAG TPA: pirin family protein [Bacteroidia bacterium]|jgi:redox-sensitive bicupin YhaK (pirin superfamily)|nr:pirin family protein [Bacteroidia bacterium]HMU19239.1 pirin family protein [Bacteroidia bacterium]